MSELLYRSMAARRSTATKICNEATADDKPQQARLTGTVSPTPFYKFTQAFPLLLLSTAFSINLSPITPSSTVAYFEPSVPA